MVRLAGHAGLKALIAIEPLSAGAAFPRHCVRAVSDPAPPGLPDLFTCAQNPLFPFSSVRFIEAGVRVLDAHERRSTPVIFLYEHAICSGLDEIAFIRPLGSTRFFALHRDQVSRGNADQCIRFAFQSISLRDQNRYVLSASIRVDQLS